MEGIESEFQRVPVQALIDKKKSHFQKANLITQLTSKIWFTIVKELHLEKQIQITNQGQWIIGLHNGSTSEFLHSAQFQALKDKLGLI